MKRILVLYRELAGYFVECLNHLCEKYDVAAIVVAYPVHADAPFEFASTNRIQYLDRSTLSAEKLESLTSDPSFHLIFCGGWGDKGYLRALKKRKTHALLGFDNQWNGSLKHQASALYGRVKLKPLFEYAFVPGSKQFMFAQHLGFSADKIITGAYSCDVPRFSSVFAFRKTKEKSGKRKLIYVGRYAEEKFILPLLSLMKNFHEEGINWELHCVGKGPLWEKRIESPGIIHHGFMQPASLYEFMKTGDAFILPSTFEPWGVVVHEFACAGYPMILSDHVGASEVFLKNEENGFLFRAGEVEDLKNKLSRLFQMEESELQRMGSQSAVLAMVITPDTWAKSIYSIM